MLINLKTNLTSLKFGKDKPGGGSSNQPYIEKPLNLDLPSAFDFLGNDFILRGGPVGAPLATVNDIARLTKYFTDFKNPSGLLFIAKQNLLSRTAVKTQTSGILNEGIYTPLSTLAQVGVSAFGLHLNKQGLNPFEETGPRSNNENLYEVRMRSYNEDASNSPDGILKNRLVALQQSKISGSYDSLGYGFGKVNNISPDNNIILSYPGGPDSELGIGKTNIYFADQRTGLNNINLKNSGFFKTTYVTTDDEQFGPQNIESTSFNLDYSVFKRPLVSINGNKLLGLSDKYNDYFPSVIPITLRTNGFTSDGNIDSSIRNVGLLNVPDATLSDFIDKTSVSNLTYNEGIITYDQNLIGQVYNSELYSQGPILPSDFRKVIKNYTNLTQYQKDISKEIGNLSNSPDYSSKNIEQRVKLGDPGYKSGKNLNSYVSGSFLGAASSNSYDKINTIKIYDSTVEGVNPDNIGNDLVKFRIGVYDIDAGSKKYIHFRAFLDQISDQYISEYDSIRYIGRGENLYTYKGFDRKLSLSWTVAAQSKIELIPMYKKLNYLSSVCAPDYSKNGYMRGNIITLTIGGYLYEQPGIITGFTYEMNDESDTWEIGINEEGGYDNSVKELPHVVRVKGFNFIPIHEFVPRKVQGTGNSDVNERYISLQAQTNNYSDQWPVPLR